MKTRLLDLLFTQSKADDLIILKDQVDYSNIRFANNSITSSGHVQRASFFFISIIKGKVGVVSADDVDTKEKAIELIRKSELIAQENEEAEDVAPLISGEEKESEISDMFSFEPTVAANEEINTLTDNIGNVIGKLTEYNNSGFGEVKNSDIFLANSKGLRKFYSDSYAYLGVTTKTIDFSKSVWHGLNGHKMESIHHDELIKLIQRDLQYQTDHKTSDPGRYEVILSPYVVADFLVFLLYMSAMRDSDEGRGIYSIFDKGLLVGNAIGQKLFPEHISIYSDPYDKVCSSLPFVASVASSSFSSIFDTGAMKGRVDWIKSGVVRNLISTRAYARQKQLTPAFFPSNILMEGTNKEATTLISHVKKGLYINNIWYVRMVDPVTGLLTGLTRDGVYTIEDGKITGSTNNFRFNQSPLEVLKNTQEISMIYPTIPREFDEGDDLFMLPYLRVKDFNMSTVSEAI